MPPARSVWEWAGTEEPDRRRNDLPDVVLAAAGDVPTMEVLAAAQLLRRHVPHLRVRVVNVVDLMGLLPVGEHPAAFSPDRFTDLFTDTVDVVFAFHGHPRAIHPLLHGRPGRRPVPRPRLHRARHDDHAVRHGRAEPDEPL